MYEYAIDIGRWNKAITTLILKGKGCRQHNGDSKLSSLDSAFY